MKKKILMIMPRFPHPPRGACEQDRLSGIKQLIRLGHEIHIIAKVFDFQDLEAINILAKDLGVKITTIPYRKRPEDFLGLLKLIIKRTFSLSGYDGAAYEYTDGKIVGSLKAELDSWKPNLVWFEYTYLWPLYFEIRKRRIPIITRSANFEPIHFLQEDGRSIANLLKFIPKLFSEFMTVVLSDFIFSITPEEQKTYRRMFAKKVATLPLRSLPPFIGQNTKIKNEKTLHVFFMGSTYSVAHNREAAAFLIKEVFPLATKTYPNKFLFHVLGSKLPDELARLCAGNITYENYIPAENLADFFDKMDVCLTPSLFGAGMQQKIFEPIAKGIPTITAKRGIAGYDFADKREVVFAEDVRGYVEALEVLADASFRQKISENAVAKSRELFSQDSLDRLVESAINSSLSKYQK